MPSYHSSESAGRPIRVKEKANNDRQMISFEFYVYPEVLIPSMIVYVVQLHLICLQSNATKGIETEGKKVGKSSEFPVVVVTAICLNRLVLQALFVSDIARQLPRRGLSGSIEDRASSYRFISHLSRTTNPHLLPPRVRLLRLLHSWLLLATNVLVDIGSISSLSSHTLHRLPTLSYKRRRALIRTQRVNPRNHLRNSRLYEAALAVSGPHKDGVDTQEDPAALGEDDG